MNQDIKTKWVNALRSGEYKQTSMKLCDGTAYCCLGVLGDLYAKSHNTKWVAILDTDIDETVYTLLDSEFLLPSAVMQWAVVDEDPLVKIPNNIIAALSGDREHLVINKQTYLSVLNDNVGLTFNELADLIEASL